ncbi:helix-turn-helix transcriptional regulator [Nesterenkonia xinjiangensis]
MAPNGEQAHSATGILLARADSAPRATRHPRQRESRQLVQDPHLLGSVMFETASETLWSLHNHPCEHELLWPLTGALTVTAAGRISTVLPGQGAWLRAGEGHEVSTRRPTRFGVTFVRTDAPGIGSPATGTSAVTPALRELLIHMNREQLDLEAHLRLQRACLDLMTPARMPRPSVPVPQDPRLTPLVHGLLEDCGDPRSLHEWAEELHLSTRTISRALHAATGMPFSRWRRQLRIQQAQTLLADGETVTSTAWQVGYLSTSAFVAAFRTVTGVTPATLIPPDVDQTPLADR